MRRAAACLCALLPACFVHVRQEPLAAPRPLRSWPASERAPRPVGPYSQAVRVGDTLWLAGQVGLDAHTGALVEGGVAPQTERALANLQAVLESAGMGLCDVVEVQVFLADMADFAAMNAVYAQAFAPPAPARTTVGVAALPLGAAVEIRAVAVAAR
jgi:2-iminobutanoate/2-iminopropanoate deaminase